jgi:hypothetical protein
LFVCLFVCLLVCFVLTGRRYIYPDSTHHLNGIRTSLTTTICNTN